MLYVSGKTEDGRRIVSGFFKLVDGQGVHLTMVLDHFQNEGLVPDWLGFLQDTVDSRWNVNSTLEKISVSCFEVYGPEHRDIVMNMIKTWIANNW